MLKPSMNELMAKVSNRYLLVNLTAQRARDLSEESEKTHEKLRDKPVKLARAPSRNPSRRLNPLPRLSPR